SQTLHFGQSVHDNGWGLFTTFLQYKLAEQGKKLIKIDKWFPSSKTCSCCGQVKVSLSLTERQFRCECGFVADRDTNAAINIKKEGLKQLGIT
ncbi:transposase IS605 OrfB, partial [Caldalkalibacillus thermarum TA2.A1]